jgi:hypothetical protein
MLAPYAVLQLLPSDETQAGRSLAPLQTQRIGEEPPQHTTILSGESFRILCLIALTTKKFGYILPSGAIKTISQSSP